MATKKMAANPTAAKNLKDPDILQVHEGLEGITKEMSESDIAARMSTRGYVTSHAMRAYAGFSKEMVSVTSIDNELRANGDAVAAGDLGRLERMLISQAITLDAIFANLAERSSRQEYLKNMETYMRLAMKAQAQCRATAETLAIIKNPQPYIKQANIAQGPQQVNNAYASGGIQPHAGNSQSEPNKLLEADHDQRLDIGAQAAAGRANPHMETVDAIHRA